MQVLLSKINHHYDNLSSGLKKVALHLLTEPESFALYSAGEVGKKIGVSETTVIRFSHALDFKGYSSLQKEVKQAVFNQRSTLQAYSSKIDADTEKNIYKKVMHTDAKHIQIAAEGIQEKTFNEAVERISTAEKILVSGVRSSHGMAQWFTFALNLVKGNTNCYRPDVDDVFLHLSAMDEKSVVVAFSFHRYALDTLHLAEEAKKRGAFVIGVTDNERAPIRESASLLLPIQLPVRSTLDAAPAVFSLMNALVSAVAMENEADFEKRREAYEQFHVKNFFA
ncbi:MurR/RpiR family transcriptional regulator [Alteribacter populi]|uniref:MurR/RpiR family transcriptional regulator n=1 Tax=Alteribacter populi TaxID=2011011 RepID=UPI000BBAF4FE|nr:MurR/RpiR family transcriptional regulator [Alteribacter populi]